MIERLGNTTLSQKGRLMILVGRSEMDAKTIEDFRSVLNSNLNWKNVSARLKWHKLLSLFFFHLKEHGQDYVPEDVFAHHEQLFHKNVRRNMIFAKELLRVITLFEQNNITIIPYKGTVLAAQAYGNLTLRECADLDVLICKSNVNLARELLIESGYEAEINIKPQHQSALFWSECDQVFINKELNIYLELHWGITPPYFSFPLETEQLIKNHKEFDFMGRKVLTPSTEDLILILCVNATKEMWRNLEWLCSLSEIIRQNENVDWALLIEISRKLRSLRMVLLGLYLTKEIFQVKLSDEVLMQIKNDKAAIETLAEKVYTSLFSEYKSNAGLININLFRLKARESWRDKIRYCTLRFLTPTHHDLNFISLSQKFLWLYYFVRPVRLFVELFQTKAATKQES